MNAINEEKKKLINTIQQVAGNCRHSYTMYLIILLYLAIYKNININMIKVQKCKNKMLLNTFIYQKSWLFVHRVHPFLKNS